MELKYDIDNRDAGTTWLQIKTLDGEELGHVELRTQDMFELIENLYENNPDMDTSDIENGIELLEKLVYPRYA